MSMPRPIALSLLTCCALLALLVPAQAQAPGEVPRLVLTDGAGNTVPTGPGPWNNSFVFEAESGLVISAQLTYLALGGDNTSVPWGLLVSTEKTAFPTGVFPPPLFVQPPFLFLQPTPPMLDVAGQGAQPLIVPAGLYEGTFYVQALVKDAGMLRLSNGVRIDVAPPPFNARFSYVVEAPALSSVGGFLGVGHEDLGPDVLGSVPPLGDVLPPGVGFDDVGLPPGFHFLPIVPLIDDEPITPLARPKTVITAPISGEPTDNVFMVEDTSYFPSSGTLYVEGPEGNRHPWRNKTVGGTRAPTIEVVTYQSKTATSFVGVTRRRLGSVKATGNVQTYQHFPGNQVIGEFTMGTTSGARSRSRVSLDAENPLAPHVVIPAITVVDPDSGLSTTLDQDLFLFEDETTKEQAFCVLDRVTDTYRVLTDTLLDASTGDRRWDAAVAVSPDRRWFVAIERVETGPEFASDPDRVWLVRLDGRDWPAVPGSQAWEITYEAGPEPVVTDDFIRSRRVHTPSIAILDAGDGDAIVFVGLTYRFQQTVLGQAVITEGSVNTAFEGFWVRENMLVRDYIDIPVADVDSTKGLPTLPRPRITDDFPLAGGTNPVIHFDPRPLVSADKRQMLVVAGVSDNFEDAYIIRNPKLSASGEPIRLIQNLTGEPPPSQGLAQTLTIRPLDPGTGGVGPKAAFSPDGSLVAVLMADGNDRKDHLYVLKTNGSTFGNASPIFSDSGVWRATGPTSLDRAMSALRWLDSDRILLHMGQGYYDDPFGLADPADTPNGDLWIYRVSTDEIVNLTNTSGSATGFEELGAIRIAAAFSSPNARYDYFLRDGTISQGNTVLPPGTPVMNLLAFDRLTETVFDVSGDELGGLAPLRSLDVPEVEFVSPVEAPVTMGFVEGTGSQSGTMWIRAHEAALGSEADELFFFNMDAPFVGLQLTSFSPPGSHIGDVTPDPFGARTAFSQSAGSDPLANDQHAFLADFTSFAFVRDLTPSLVSGGQPFGRLMPGSFHFLPPGPGLTDSLIFSMGTTVDTATGIPRNTGVVYLHLANVADLLLEPEPLLLPLLGTDELGSNYRILITSAGPSVNAPTSGP